MPNHKNSPHPIIIILNGCSASGKTTVQKLLQAKMTEMTITVGIDTFFDALLPTPDLTHFAETKILEQYTNDHELIRSVKHIYDEQGNLTIPLTIGPAGNRVIHGMHHAIAAYARAGNNVIVDYILYDPAWITYLQEALEGYTVYMIAFKLPLEAIEMREKKRATSPVGHARSHYQTVHQGMHYDLEITDPNTSPEIITDMILAFIKEHKNPTAFAQIKHSNYKH